MNNVRFVWVTHNSPESLELVKNTLKQFRPELIGLELDKPRLKKLLAYEKREASEFYAAYLYSKAHKVPLAFLDRRDNLGEFRMGPFGWARLVMLLLLKNLIRVFSGKCPRKLSVKDVPGLEEHVVGQRDAVFIRRITHLVGKSQRKRILFIFGKAHRKGILKGLAQTF
jgi:pheromone shutdown protein TraB